ncbi:undecaprenyldiphospho-muramoylpentapeptide beta-N-acetylglucosaminyltransferase [Falsibacillus pallidus]|uniref:UDP-N-acetylglucosamine--N-acetylmuramyl-(pentapeptide) pyrophosphoryl-undecaprenol N-acetylglucosamine transferase n=1 Tax=Falsibacillus pallidus TaxID=493781 RepID=A0A370GPU9_9BACI|nr:undecaprenyldiphospho-muramoylpentapeptide beta-N-acetylglucosaminyltransferase [Falsibacillus pallidus]RDI45551.1 UDP-N-acetylglucosamine-N-acetylmuramylpentapeptide N-acetylglucosamine transferase [Falsibacillus pallidus]
MTTKRIVFTGGGSAGHVTPNMAIINELGHEWDISYIGSKEGIEKELIEKMAIPYNGIHSGKLRRYFDLENVSDLFKVLKGCFEARQILKKLKPAVVFSKGGFVTVPVVIAAKSLGIPVYIHESDITPGLANKIAQRFSTRIFTSFKEAKQYFPDKKTKVAGSPIRKALLFGSATKGREVLGLKEPLPIITIMGGSLGAKKINEAVRESLPQITAQYQVVHLCGKNQLDPLLSNHPRYRQYEYVHDELADILAATDLVVTRGGSNAIFEFLALKIPMIIIPLGRDQSRGDQILNAKSFQDKGYSITLEENDLTNENLVKTIEKVFKDKEKFQSKMRESSNQDALQVIIQELNKMQ